MFKLLSRYTCAGGRRAAAQLICDGKFEVRKARVYVYSAAGAVRHASTTPTGLADTIKPIVDKIPDAPAIPENFEFVETVVQTLAANGEPTFQSIGLGSWWPAGIVQQCLEYLHVSLDVPWWGAIVIGTIVVRVAMFPLVIKSQRNAALMNNYLPEMQVLQLKMTQARQTGNQLDSTRYAQEMMLFMKEKGLNPLKNMIVPMVQAPFFISFFVGLRGMANCPVASMTSGGLWWFTDLTVPDQYFILPVLTSITMWATIELGTDTAKLQAQNMHMMKYFLRALPIVMVPFTLNFSGAILVYWTSSNFISLIQVGILRIPAVRDYFKIPHLHKHTAESLPIKNKGFVAGAKDSWMNIKLSRELAERQRVDEMIFMNAGKGPLQKTYKIDPTKPISTIQAKSK